VKEGQVLARLDPLQFQIAKQKAEAALAQAQAQEKQAQAKVESAKADATQMDAQIAQAEAQVQQMSAELDMANTNFGRNERILQSDARAVSKSELDNTKNTAQASRAAVTAAQANLQAAKAHAGAAMAAVDSAQAEVVAAQAAIAAQEAAGRDAERELSYVEIKAPLTGRIGNKNVEPGNRVQVGQALFAIVGEETWIVANFKETQLRKMQVGQPVEITVDAIDGRDFTGRLESFSPASGAQFALLPPDNATGNFTKVVQRVPVKIVFDPASIRGVEDRLHPGLSTVVNVRIK
jgi:membrane fusion protein (multidrug efflux system)